MIIIDVETGGLDPQKDALVEVALFDTVDRELVTWLVRPCKWLRWSEEAERVHGMSLEYCERLGLDECHVMKEVAAWLEKRRPFEVGGANPRFDMDFLRAAAMRNGVELGLWCRPVDVQSVAWVADKIGRIELPRKKEGGPPSCSLDAILETLGRSRDGAKHSAAEDVTLTAFAFQRLQTLLELGRVVR
jgi:DNA polymerase III epsilon subunit-like protein